MAKSNGGTRGLGSEPHVPTFEEMQNASLQEAVSAFGADTFGGRSPMNLARRNIGQIRETERFSKDRTARMTREATLEAIGRMYGMYDIGPMKELLFTSGNATYQGTTSPEGRYMKIEPNTRRGYVTETAIHEMTHAMLGGKFQKVPKELAFRIRRNYDAAIANVPAARGANAAFKNYWREDVYEFASVVFQKALTGQSLNQYERDTFVAIHNHFKRR